MAVWTYTQWTARLNHEIKGAESAMSPQSIARLKTSLRACESFLEASDADPADDDEWILLLRTLERGLDAAGERHD